MGSAVVGALSVIAAALIALVGAAWTVRQAYSVQKEAREERTRLGDVDQRKLDQETFREFIKRYEEESERERAKRADMERSLERSQQMVRVAVDYILRLRTVMREHRIEPPPTPDELAAIPWKSFDSFGD